MALFSDQHRDDRPTRRGSRVGWTFLIIAILGTLGFTLVPAPYVIEEPGPVFNTLGTVPNGSKQVPLIEIPGQKTYPTSGALDMLTVNVSGNRDQPPSWFDVARAWLDPSRAVVPVDAIYPIGTTVEQSNQQATVDMQNSQKDAVAAALTHLGYTLPTTVLVGGFSPDSPASAVLKTGDVIVSVNGQAVSSVLGLRAIVAKGGAGVPLTLVISRARAEQTVQITPVLSTDRKPVPIIGIFPSVSYTLPFDVKIELENVGGPSAGQMFALGIIDKLTAGYLNGGARVAGTGTIDGDGNIGPIGGIRQKLYGAVNSGATWFLAPYSNCAEVVGHVPSGIKVLAVRNLDDSLLALTAIKSGSSTSGLLSCTSK